MTKSLKKIILKRYSKSLPHLSKEEILSWERELLGFYLTEHPLTKFATQIQKIISLKIGDIDPISHDQNQVTLGGIIASIRKTFTKVKKEEMCFLKLQDTSASIEVIVFPRIYRESQNIIQTDKIVIINGKIEAGEDTPVLIADKIILLEEAIKKSTNEEVFEVIIPKTADRILLAKIYEALKENPGDLSTYLILPDDNNKGRKVAVPFGISKNIELEDKLLKLGCLLNN